MAIQLFNTKTGQHEWCNKCTPANLPGPGWVNTTVALGREEFAALTGNVIALGENTMRGQLLVAWMLDGDFYESSWHHTHELDVIKVKV